ncbi:hypothetical protein GCM10027592_50130 [Spirosoma flavus]
MKKHLVYLLFIFILCSADFCGRKDNPEPESDPVASFNFQLQANGEVKFVNNSKNAIGYRWTFGDGEFSEEINPVHIYKIPKKYITKLIAKSKTDLTSEQEKEMDVNNINPEAKFSYRENSDGEILFFNESKYAETYLWNFGDAQTSTESNPKHQYKQNGNYKINLLVENRSGKNVVEKEIRIESVKPKCIVSLLNDSSIFTNINYTETNDIYKVSISSGPIESPVFKDGKLVQFGNYQDFDYDANKRIIRFQDIYIDYDTVNRVSKVSQINTKYSQYYRFEYNANSNLNKIYSSEKFYGLNEKEIEVSSASFDDTINPYSQLPVEVKIYVLTRNFFASSPILTIKPILLFSRNNFIEIRQDKFNIEQKIISFNNNFPTRIYRKVENRGDSFIDIKYTCK